MEGGSNCMSIYTLDQLVTPPGEPEVLGIKLTQRSIYGSSRVGTENPDLLIARTDVSLIHEFDYVQTVGDRRYELSNHLGNVLNVVTDRKLPVEDGTNPGEVDYFIADVASQNDYYPFGMLLPNTSDLPDEDDHRYGFNGMEDDQEVTNGNGQSYDFGARFYNPRVGRWLSTDPLYNLYPDNAPFVFAINSPLILVDIDGRILKDPSGNIIFTANGEATVGTDPTGKSFVFQAGYVYSDEGEQIEVQLVLYEYDSGTGAMTTPDVNDTYNCHGQTILDGRFFVNSDIEVSNALHLDNANEDINTPVEDSKSLLSFDPLKIKEDDVIVYFDKDGKVIHSAVYIGEGEVETKNGFTDFKVASESEVYETYKAAGAVGRGYYTPGTDKELDVDGIIVSGIVIVDQEEVEKHIEVTPPPTP